MTHLGNFTVSTTLASEQPEVLADALATMRFIPYRVEHHYAIDAFEYVGTSPMFRETTQGESIPKYTVDVNVTAKGSVHVEVREVPYDQRNRPASYRPVNGRPDRFKSWGY